MTKLHIYDAINDRAHVSFHTPGHKGAENFTKLFPGAGMDVTELSFSGSLLGSEGVIGLAQRDIAEILGAKASFITTDGSTSGIFSMLYVAKRRGGRVAIPRYCHMSVYNACVALHIEPVVMNCAVKEGVPLPPSAEEIEKAVARCGEKVGAVLLVSPDYYGNIADLEAARILSRKYGFLLIVDGAHGSHLFAEDTYAGRYADMWVDGTHKSLPTLTQGAVVSAGREDLTEDLEGALNVFRTSSPSYLVMASVEYGVKYLADNREKLERAKNLSKDIADALYPMKTYHGGDWTKICVDFLGTGYDPGYVAKGLELCGVYPELCDGRYILLYMSVETTKADRDRLILAFRTVTENRKCLGECVENVYTLPKKICGFLDAVGAENEYVPLDAAKGRVAASVAGIAPPCMPRILPGEEITEDVVKTLGGKGSFGIKDGKIKAVKG